MRVFTILEVMKPPMAAVTSQAIYPFIFPSSANVITLVITLPSTFLESSPSLNCYSYEVNYCVDLVAFGSTKILLIINGQA